jgi:acyl-CoA thioesterase-1
MITFTPQTKLLFIGDSITDCGRRECPEQIGNGYVRLIRDSLLAASPATAPGVINRGVSGNKIGDLEKRWQRDVLDLSPDVLSIYVGINDVWHGLFPGREGTTIDRFIAGYRDILARTRDALPNCRLVLCEPGVIWPPVHEAGNEKLAPFVRAVHETAAAFSADHIVPLHGAFNDARAARPEIHWTTDGVHPTSAGHMLIAHTWISAVARS